MRANVELNSSPITNTSPEKKPSAGFEDPSSHDSDSTC